MSRRANTMLSRRWAGGTSNIIYQLYNHTCDGTAATCIDTGIKLFSQTFIQEHPKFQIEISYQAEDNNSNNAHIIRCCRIEKFTNYAGFHIRFTTGYQPYNTYHIQFNSNGGSTTQRFYTSVSSEEDILLPVIGLIINLDFTTSGSVTIEVKNRNSDLPDVTDTRSFNINLFGTTPFVIGGSVTNGVDASGGWKEMWNGTITSLIIRDI